MEQNNTPKKGRKKLIFPIILAVVLDTLRERRKKKA